MDSLSRKYIRETNKISFDRLAPSTVLRIKDCIKHQLACCCAGRSLDWNEVMRKYIRSSSCSEGSTIWFSDMKANDFEATLANGTMGMSVIQEDIHREDGIHPGYIIIPAAFAVGERYHCSGKAVAEAVVRGYQFLCKTGKAVLEPDFGLRGFRATPIMGTYGAAVTAGTLMGLSEDQLVDAVGIAGNFSCGVNQWAAAGVEEVHYHNGMSAAAGVMAAELAKNGGHGSEDIFEGRFGTCSAYSLSKEILEQNIRNDSTLEIDKVVFKGAPCCNFNQATATLGVIAAKDGLTPDMVESGIIWTNTRAKLNPGCDCQGPILSVTHARMSMQYTFAAILFYGKAINDVFCDFHNSPVTRLASNMTVEIDPEFDSHYPEHMYGAVDLLLKTGEKRRYQVEEAYYFTREDIESNFRLYVSRITDQKGVDELISLIDRLENLEDINELTRHLQIKTPR